MIEIKCPNGHRLNVPAEFIGKQIRCAACQETFTVPDQASAPPQVNTGAASADPVPPPPEDIGVGVGVSTEEPAAPAPVTRRRRPAGGIAIDQLGKPLLFAGLCIVLLARGCDGLGVRNIGRLQANAAQAPKQFERETRRLTEAEDDRAKKQKIREERDKRRQELMSGRWRTLSDSASDAQAQHAGYAYIYQILFVFGSMILSVGLLTVGFTGTGAERTICLIMISIITFSIYIGGIAWIDSITSGYMGMLPNMR